METIKVLIKAIPDNQLTTTLVVLPLIPNTMLKSIPIATHKLSLTAPNNYRIIKLIQKYYQLENPLKLIPAKLRLTPTATDPELDFTGVEEL